jgi:PAS domain S-box-containing protein
MDIKELGTGPVALSRGDATGDEYAGQGVLLELAALYEHAPIALLLFDTDVRVIRVNSYAAKIAGRKREEMIGMVGGEAMRCVHHQEDPRGCGFSAFCDSCSILQVVLETLRDKVSKDKAEGWITIDKDGVAVDRCFMISSAYLQIDGRENVLFCAQDITDQKLAEKALRESEQRWQFALEGAGDGLWDWNAETDEVFYSRQWKAMLGYEEHEIGNTLKEWDSRVHPEDREYVYAEIYKHFDGLTPVYVSEHRLRCKDGSYKWILDRGKVISRNAEGRPVRVIGTHTDITERKEAEAEKKRLEAQLMQAQKMESVGRLAGGVAHDYNNMLGVIMGHAELALAKLGNKSEVKGDLEQILSAAHRSADITKKLLGFARKQTISPRILDLNETVAGMLKMLRRLIGEKVEIAWMPAGRLKTVRMDPSQLDQILANLVVNSKDAMPKGGRITIKTGMVVLDRHYCNANPGFVPGEYVMLSVSDNGCGIEKDILDHIFEPFFTTKEIGKGTGLGLSTVYGIVKQNEGFIKAYSEPGKGTTMKIFLPPQQEETDEKAGEGVLQIRRVMGEGILLVEDEEGIRNITGSILERLNYRVLSASSGEQAARLSENDLSGIQLLMTDVVMPGMDGKELAAILRQRRPGLKIIYMSGYADEAVIEPEMLKHGARFISKPFSVADLASLLRDVLEGLGRHPHHFAPMPGGVPPLTARSCPDIS